MTSKVWFVVMAICAGVCVGGVKAQTTRETSREDSDRNRDAVLKYVQPVIKSSGKAFRLYYRATCHPIRDFVLNDPVPFPFTRVQPPREGETGLEAVREIFKDDENVTVKEEPVGIIRIWIGKVPTAILETKISRVSLDPIGQYNPMNAIDAIINTNEMEVAMGSLKMNPVADLGGLVAEPQNQLPHLPASMTNVSVEQALDEIAKTWAGEGMVVYGACTDPTGSRGEKLFWLGYTGDVVPK
jgi:hypothetical protein